MRSTVQAVLVLWVGLLGPVEGAAQLQTFRMDKPHTLVTFTVGYTGGLTEVEGRFREHAGTIEVDPNDLTTGRAEITFQVQSLDTGHDRRDADLRSETWFNVERYPTIRFASTSVERTPTGFILHGTLTVKEISKAVSIPFTRSHEQPVVWVTGRPHVGFRGELELDRTQFRLPESGEGGVITAIGKLFIGKRVGIRIVLQAVGPGLEDLLYDTIIANGVPAGLSQYEAIKRQSEGKDTYVFEAPILTFLVMRLVREKHAAEAMAVAPWVVEQFPESHFSHYGLALAYQANGKTAEAMTHVDRALEIRPGHRLSLRLKGELTKAAGRPDGLN